MERLAGFFHKIASLAASILPEREESPSGKQKRSIRQLEDRIRDVLSALEACQAAEESCEDWIGGNGQLIDKRARQAELAVDREQDDIAALALQEKRRHEELQATCLEQREAVRGQKRMLQEELARLRELHLELTQLLSFQPSWGGDNRDAAGGGRGHRRPEPGKTADRPSEPSFRQPGRSDPGEHVQEELARLKEARRRS